MRYTTFLMWANPGLFFVYFGSFHIPIQMKNTQFELYKSEKSKDGLVVLEPGVAESQTNPLSYDGSPYLLLLLVVSNFGVLMRHSRPLISQYSSLTTIGTIESI